MNTKFKHAFVVPSELVNNIIPPNAGYIRNNNLIENRFDSAIEGGIYGIREPGKHSIEDSLYFQQIIPYITIGMIEGDQSLLLFKRRQEHTDQRLSSKFTVGVGGHIDIVDNLEFDLELLILNAAGRELREELPWLPSMQSSRIALSGLRGYIRTLQDAVSSVHIGVHMHICIDGGQDTFNPDGTLLDNANYWLDMWEQEKGNNRDDLELELVGFWSPDATLGMQRGDEMEEWSKIVTEEMTNATDS